MQTTLGQAIVFVIAASACGSQVSAPEPAEPTGVSPAGAPEVTFAAQVERGAALYGANCASCHGDGGQGTATGPAVVGKGALPLQPPPGAKHRQVPFRTAMDVFLWVKKTMPADAPGSLTDAEYVDILAFDLKANGVELDTPLDADVAKSLSLH